VEREHVVAVAGDAAFTCGITYEALNNVAHHTKRPDYVLNDNELVHRQKRRRHCQLPAHKIVTSPQFEYLHDRAGKFVEKVGGVTALRMAAKSRRGRQGNAVA